MNIVFDWAGTLADDRELTWRLTDEVIQSFGGAALSFDAYRREFSLPAENFYRARCPGVPFAEIEAAFAKLCRENYPREARLWPGVKEALVWLSYKHRLFLLSSLDEAMLISALEAQGLRAVFQGVRGGAADKRQVLPALLREWSLAQDETVAVGDTPHDVAAAKAASVQPLAVAFGYASAAELEAAGPDLIFATPQELFRYFDKLACAESRHFPVATVGGLIFDAEGKFLLVRTRKWSNQYGIPGGKIDYGETMEAAFAREAREETGLEVEGIKFIMAQDCVEHPEFYRPRHFILINYTARVPGRAPKVVLNHEADDYAWVDRAEAAALPVNGPTRVLLEEIFAKGKG
jgi:phosphoglycolate phosphatase-like HAD superfamily hydrolase/ADP-ribose pyrophosphatase YjhB (NUDIX family)